MDHMEIAEVVLYKESGDHGRVYKIAPEKHRTFTIGRGGPVDCKVEQPHISANQAGILPPVPDAPMWRLVDTSTNGTLVNGKLVGKNNKVTLSGQEKINFSVRDYPYMVFRLRTGPPPAEQVSNTSSAEGADPSADRGAKRRRGSAVDGSDAAGAALGLPAQPALERQLQKVRNEYAGLQAELAGVRRQLEAKEAALAAAENAAAEAAKANTVALAEMEERLTAEARAAAHEARETQRQQAQALDEATAAKHGLEQRLAAAEEAAAAAASSLSAAQDVGRPQRPLVSVQ